MKLLNLVKDRINSFDYKFEKVIPQLNLLKLWKSEQTKIIAKHQKDIKMLMEEHEKADRELKKSIMADTFQLDKGESSVDTAGGLSPTKSAFPSLKLLT